MKLRSTTSPASISRVAKFGVIFALVAAISIFGFIFANRPASANYDAKIRNLTNDMSRFQAEANRLNGEAATLSNTLAQLTNDKNALQSQVDLSQAQHDKLVIEINETEKKIEENREALGSTLVDLYAGDSVSPIEMLASSQNIGDFLDKQEYRSSVQDSLSGTIKTVKELRTKLQDQKTEVAKVLNDQKVARDGIAAKESEQASILAKTQSDEAAFQNLVKDRQKEIADARAAQAALAARINAGGGSGSVVNAGSLGDYPWHASNCPMWGYLSTGGADGNGGDGRGYGCRQCASYAAWKIAKETGIYYRWGNGGDFYGNAVRAGYQDLGRSPQAGSIAVMLGNPGHVAWVEDVSGSQVRVSQYNYNYGAGWGMYSDMWLPTSTFDKFVKIK